MEFDYNDIIEGLKEFKEDLKYLEDADLKQYELKDFKQSKSETKAMSNLLIDYMFVKAKCDCLENRKKSVSTADMLGYLVDALEAMWLPI